jgi:restriction-modification system family protein
MALTLNDHLALLKGFPDSGFHAIRQPNVVANPIVVEWRDFGRTLRYRLWAFDITHGGGGATVRAADEFRIQITNGPATLADLDAGDAVDLLIGYSRDRDAIVAYDRRWLENWIRKKEQTGSGGSPSVQVKEADIQAGHRDGIHHLTKQAGFGTGDIVTMSPVMFPVYLANQTAVLNGSMTAAAARAAASESHNMTVVDYCADQGFPFEPDLIARYLASVMTKPFVILAGVSGTGKSKLAELVAEYYSDDAAAAGAASATPTPGDSFVFAAARGTPSADRFALVAVRPDWIDNQSILGFVNPITQKYESTQALDLILRARRDLDAATSKPSAPRYFMLLDEMNLARVEHYFSDWLACTESRRLRTDSSVTQQAVPLHRAEAQMKTTIRLPDGSTEQLTVPAALELPTNLIVTGTVNVDETTYGFSPKVLDRAMVLEFDEVDLDRLRSGSQKSAPTTYRFPAALSSFRLATRADYARIPAGTHAHLTALNDLLKGARLHFGYRAANEMGLFMSIYNEILPSDDTDVDWVRALDAAVLQKVLPRLSGNRAKLELPLAGVCSYLRDLTLPTTDVTVEEFDPNASARLTLSYRRAVDMLESLRSFGFVSFFK